MALLCEVSSPAKRLALKSAARYAVNRPLAMTLLLRHLALHSIAAYSSSRPITHQPGLLANRVGVGIPCKLAYVMMTAAAGGAAVTGKW